MGERRAGRGQGGALALSERSTGESAWLILIDPTTGIVVSAVITILYSTAGGFMAGVWTDAVQAILMILTIIVTPVIALLAGAGAAVVASLVFPDGQGSGPQA